MEFMFLIFLILLLFGIWSIVGRLVSLNDNLSNELSEFNGELEKIYELMGGDLKLREVRKKEQEDLKERFIQQFISENQLKSRKQAELKTAQTIRQIEDPDEFGWRRDSIERWILSSKERVRNKSKYSHLLDMAREYITKRIFLKEQDLEKTLDTDWIGARWLLEMLESEKKVERILDYKGDLSTEIKHWKVV